MPNLVHAIEKLLEEVEAAPSETTRIEIPVDPVQGDHVVPWMAKQPIFPKFYWQSRDTTEETVALGQARTFSDINPAYSVLSCNQRIWGGYAFPRASKRGGCLSSYFFLPQIELLRRRENWFIAANLLEDKDALRRAIYKLVADLSSGYSQTPDVESVQHKPTKSHWEKNVNLALKTIEDTELKKVVLARQTVITLSAPMQGYELLNLSRAQNRHSFHFLMQLDAEHAFIGSTPERLYSRRGSLLETEALAGTIGRDTNPSQDLELANWLIQDEKNLQENQYVVDDIIERLTPFCQRVDVEQEPRLVRLRRVQHLKRHIQAELTAYADKSKLLQALQPTAAVAGLPRAQALEFIEQNEPFSRSWYAGSLGYISETEAEFCVAIRSALVQGKRISLFAGAGIVPGSQADHEWQELDKKMSTLLSLITEKSVLEQAS